MDELIYSYRCDIDIEDDDDIVLFLKGGNFILNIEVQYSVNKLD